MATMDMSGWTDAQIEIARDLGPAEINNRIRALSDYEKVVSLATAYGVEFTAKRMVAWARFAETLGNDEITITRDGTIQRPSTQKEMALNVVNAERYKRRQAERELQDN